MLHSYWNNYYQTYLYCIEYIWECNHEDMSCSLASTPNIAMFFGARPVSVSGIFIRAALDGPSTSLIAVTWFFFFQYLGCIEEEWLVWHVFMIELFFTTVQQSVDMTLGTNSKHQMTIHLNFPKVWIWGHGDLVRTYTCFYLHMFSK